MPVLSEIFKYFNADELMEGTAFGKQLFDFAEAETESVIQPDGVTDNFSGKTMTLIAVGLVFHGAQFAKRPLT